MDLSKSMIEFSRFDCVDKPTERTGFKTRNRGWCIMKKDR